MATQPFHRITLRSDFLWKSNHRLPAQEREKGEEVQEMRLTGHLDLVSYFCKDSDPPEKSFV